MKELPVIGIVGAGAMGSVFACLMHRAGFRIRLYENDPRIVAAMRTGVRLTGADGISTVFPVGISEKPEILRDCDTIFLFVKSYATADAMKEIAPHIPGKSIVVSLQNGLGNSEIMADFIPADRIVSGATYIGATKISPDTVSLRGMGDTAIGGRNSAAVRETAGILEKSGMPVKIADNPDCAVWEKAVMNAAINPVGALLGIPNGEIITNEFAFMLQEMIVAEAVDVAASLNIPLAYGRMIAGVRLVCGNTAANLCSMLQDVRAGRKTEIDSINGKIIEYGKSRLIPAPFNEALYLLIKARELLQAPQ